jgi:hypothetical protein
MRLVTILIVLLSACGASRGKLNVDTMQYDQKTQKWVPLIEYKAPDIDEITGIDSSGGDEAEQPAGGK